MTRRRTRGPGEITIPPGSGLDQGRTCSCWPRADDPRPCTPQTCDPRCRACRSYGRPFYSHGDLLYLEHGTGPLAAELDRLWRVRGAGRRRSERAAASHDGEGQPALPRGAAGLAPPRHPHARPVTDLYHPGLQAPRPAQDGPAAGNGQ